MDQRRIRELDDRRRAQTQIDDLKRNCEEIIRERKTLSQKLTELNEIVDKLVDEKQTNKYDLNWKIDLKPYSNVKSSELTKSSKHPRDGTYSSNIRKTDLIDNYDNPFSHREQNSSQKLPSDAFKFKLFHCLQEIEPKVEEISKLSEHLYP